MDFYYTALPQAAKWAIAMACPAQRLEYEFSRTAEPAVGPGVFVGVLNTNDSRLHAFFKKSLS